MYLPFTYSSLLHFCLDIIWCWFSTHTYQYCTVIGFCYLLCGLSTASINQCYGFSTSFELISKFFYSSFNVTLKPKKTHLWWISIWTKKSLYIGCSRTHEFLQSQDFVLVILCIPMYIQSGKDGHIYIYIYIYCKITDCLKLYTCTISITDDWHKGDQICVDFKCTFL